MKLLKLPVIFEVLRVFLAKSLIQRVFFFIPIGFEKDVAKHFIVSLNINHICYHVRRRYVPPILFLQFLRIRS